MTPGQGMPDLFDGLRPQGSARKISERPDSGHSEGVRLGAHRQNLRTRSGSPSGRVHVNRQESARGSPHGPRCQPGSSVPQDGSIHRQYASREVFPSVPAMAGSPHLAPAAQCVAGPLLRSSFTPPESPSEPWGLQLGTFPQLNSMHPGVRCQEEPAHGPRRIQGASGAKQPLIRPLSASMGRPSAGTRRFRL